MRRIALVAFAAAVSACTFGHVSTVPMDVPGIGQVYRYEGRANFAHQSVEAERQMAQACQERGGGRPVMVDLSKRDVGVIGISQAQTSGTFNAQTMGSTTTGSSSGYAVGTVGGLRNMNQEILFRCVKD